MARLLTFGCSFVYGLGLPDTDGQGPSDLSWPSILAKKLKRECVNLSFPGVGNLEILMKVLSTTYEPDDLVVVSFSYFDRYAEYEFTDKNGNAKKITKETLEHKRIVLDEIFHLKNENNYWYNWLTIQHCQLFLQSNQISNISYYGGLLPDYPVRPNMLSIPNFTDTIHMDIHDWTTSKTHPGIKTHELHAEKLYKVLAE